MAHGTTGLLPQDWAGAAALPMDVDTVFNGYVAANVIFALDRIGFFTLMQREPTVPFDAARDRLGVDAELFGQLVRAAHVLRYVDLVEGDIVLTDAGRETARMRGYFTWAVGGYGEVFRQTADIATLVRRFGHDVHRDEGYVALGSGQNDAALMASTFDDVIGALDFGVLADLGSGTSERLVRVLRDRPGATGIGIDVSAAATELARAKVSAAGMTPRVQPVCANVLDIVRSPKALDTLRQADAVMSFFLLHDLLADPATRSSVLTRLREAFPRARTFLLADTVVRPATDADSHLPVFSLGFELAHALMGVPLHTKAGYEQLFGEAGLRVRRCVPFGTPHSWLYVLDAD